MVDACWPEHKLIVEIDGSQGHRTPAQLYTDHQRDLELRAAGYTILRYTERQLIETPGAVAADIRGYL
jgi:very-short-patch-repair endonuclease